MYESVEDDTVEMCVDLNMLHDESNRTNEVKNLRNGKFKNKCTVVKTVHRHSYVPLVLDAEGSGSPNFHGKRISNYRTQN